jgi:GTP-binding protein HflX
MSKKNPEPTTLPRERAFLVGAALHNEPSLLTLEESLIELALLAETAGIDIVGEATQRLDKPFADTYIGSGKVDEIKALLEESLADVVIFDNELSPRHLRELERRFGEAVHVIDRTALILDIFAQHAHTREGILQVELAQYEYRLPRLTRAWTHLARQAGGGGGSAGSVGGVGLRGPGETQLEVDRREIRHRIESLQKELEKVRAHRSRYRSQRRRTQIPIIAIVGYTNSGKSTLLNRMTKTNVFVANQLFATLDPTTRRLNLPGNQGVLLTDTVGFIQKLPTQLVAAFRATLEEIAEADLLIHVVDITHPNAMAQWKSVQQTLVDIEAGHIPVLTVLNKIDNIPDPESTRLALAEYPNSVAISALTGRGIPDLLHGIASTLFETYVSVTVKLPYQQGQLISLFHEQGQVKRAEHVRGGVLLQGDLPGRLLARYQLYLQDEKNLTTE